MGKHFPRYWPFVRRIHRSPVNSPRKGQRRGALMFSLICAWINRWVNNREAGDLRRYRPHYNVIVMPPITGGFPWKMAGIVELSCFCCEFEQWNCRHLRRLNAHAKPLFLVSLSWDTKHIPRDHSGYSLSQWETTLQCNVVSHWLRPYPELPLIINRGSFIQFDGCQLDDHQYTDVKFLI